MRRHKDLDVKRDVVTRAIFSELTAAESLLDAQIGLGLPILERGGAAKPAGNDHGSLLLTMALSEERERVLERVLLLLQLLHPTTRLDVVAENFRSDSPSRRANAVEVLDNTVRETFKKRLLPLLEDRTIAVRSHRSRDAWIASLVTGPRPWIAACAALYAQQNGMSSAVGPLETALASPVAYLREAAAQALGRLLPPGSSAALERLRDDPAREVRVAVEGALRLARLGTG